MFYWRHWGNDVALSVEILHQFCNYIIKWTDIWASDHDMQFYFKLDAWELASVKNQMNCQLIAMK